MTRIVNRFPTPSASLWKSVLLGGAIVLAPVMSLAGDKDRRERPGAKHQTATTMKAQGPHGNSSRPARGPHMELPSQPATMASKMTPKTRTNSFDFEKGRANVPALEDSTKQNSKAASKKTSSREAGAPGKKLLKPDELKGSGPQPESPGKRRDFAGKKHLKGNDFKGQKPPRELSKGNGDGKLKPTYPKGLNPQPEPPSKRLELAGKKNLKLGDKLAKGDAKHAGNFLELHKSGKFDGIVKGGVARKLDLKKQFDLKHKGDLALKLDLAGKIKKHGGWKASRWAGWISPGFGIGCSPIVYCGPWYFPSHCVYPSWCDWVSFCWRFDCDPIWDPRPFWCRPIVYEPCWTWVWWDYPVWVELPAVTCGTWVDVDPVVIDAGLDLQLLATRFVDPGHPELREGPRYRVWIRNNSTQTIVKDFNVLLMAANSRDVVEGLPQAGVRVNAIEPGQIQALDIRLPFEASTMDRDADGNAIPFSQLHVLVDSHREVSEVFEENNGAVIARGDILPVDPTIFGTDSVAPVAGSEINIAGEGFGPEPGQVLVHVGGVELQAEITGWYDLGIRAKLPALALASPTDADVVVVRGDTAASNPLTLQLTVPVAVR